MSFEFDSEQFSSSFQKELKIDYSQMDINEPTNLVFRVDIEVPYGEITVEHISRYNPNAEDASNQYRKIPLNGNTNE